MLREAGLCEVRILLQCKFLLLISLLGKIRVRGIGFASGACRREDCPHHPLWLWDAKWASENNLTEPSEPEREEEGKEKTISYPLQADCWPFLPEHPLCMEQKAWSLRRGFTATAVPNAGQAGARR